jgi:Zn-dependent protease
MNEPTPAAGEHADVARPLEITTFYAPGAAAPELRPRVPRAPASRRNLEEYRGVAIALFLATCVSVFIAGFTPGGGFYPNALYKLYSGYLHGELPQVVPEMLKEGAIYFGAIMTILVAHEMGHYLQSRRYKVPATFPFFIPMPISPFGTMGAVIIQGPGVADRKSLFDIAVSGPLAGLVFALPITLIGLFQADVGYIDPAQQGPIYGDPLILQWLVRLIHGPIPEHYDVMLNSWLFAGWVGILITALNLMPIGQLDGGHILYTLIGRRAHHVALLLLALALGFMIHYGEFAYALIVVLLFISGPRHPPTANDDVPLGPGRIVLGWLTLAFVIVGFTPFPITSPTPPPPQQERREKPAEPGELLQVRAAGARECQLAQRDFMNRSASRESCSSFANMRRQIFVAAARSGRASPNASTTIQPSYLVSLRVLKVVSQSTCPAPGVPRSFSDMWTCAV